MTLAPLTHNSPTAAGSVVRKESSAGSARASSAPSSLTSFTSKRGRPTVPTRRPRRWLVEMSGAHSVTP